MPEMKNNFQRGRMNKDLDERLVPNGEYRDALNVEVATSNDSDMGSLQTLKGNTFLGVDGIKGVCVGSIADDKNDKLYFMVAGEDRDIIIEYNYKDEEFLPVCVDLYNNTGRRALNFNEDFLITGVNIIDDLLFWTDNNSEPKKINITRGKLGCLVGASQEPSYTDHTKLIVRNLVPTAPINSYTTVEDKNGELILIEEKHLTVIKKGPSAAPVLEMIDTLADGMIDGDGLAGGNEVTSMISNTSSLTFLDGDGDFVTTNLTITTNSGLDFEPGNFLNIYKTDNRSINIRAQIISIANPPPPYAVGPPPYNTEFEVLILSGDKEIEGQEDLTVELEQQDALFQFKFPRFAYRYKYEDGEYSCFSPFTEPAFIPGKFNYLPKEGYNLGMVNNLRKLAIKDFVHERSMPEDVISIDILYKESNSPNIYSVKTVKRSGYDASKWDAWNANSSNTVAPNWDASTQGVDDGWRAITKGYLPITTEMIHAVLPANQLLRPWDNVPRKALAQEVIGNRLVYGNYLQNYNLKKSIYVPGPWDIKVDIKARFHSDKLGNVPPEELHAGNKTFLQYSPAKSVKTLRTYQLGVVYIDKYGRETPVFSEDKRGATGGKSVSESSVYVNKTAADKRNQIIVKMNSNPPEWATHRKYFIKETSNEYYNLAMDRCYDAEDGNTWLSFPSSERNKVDEETFLILKKTHDGNELVPEPAKYKIIAIENEAPRFIKLKNVSLGAIQDDGTLIGLPSEGFPFEGGTFILIDATAFTNAKWDEKLMSRDISQVYIRVKAVGAVSLWYRLKLVTLLPSAAHYKLEVDKLFGPDMTITSPDNTWGNKVTNCTVEVVKRIPEDRAEFEGRFFVKILKDGIVKTVVCPDTSIDANWVPTSNMSVQYIDPLAFPTLGGGYINTGGDAWYGQDKYKLSIDPINESYKTSSNDSVEGHGRNYWRLASDDTSDNADPNNVSSGWFIDNVEAFRIYKGNMEGDTKDLKIRWNPSFDDTRGEHTYCYDSVNITKGDPTNGGHQNLNVLGLHTYGVLGNNYLGLGPGVKAPYSDSSGNKSLIQNAAKTDGGKIAPSNGIDVDTGIINLSYSGLNFKKTEWGSGYLSTSWESIHKQSVFKEAAKHAGDQAFIEKLIQPGTVWRWKEDPGVYDPDDGIWKPVLYKTVLNDDFSTGPYTQEEWNNENGLDLSGEDGVGLFNYAVLADFWSAYHHKSEWFWITDWDYAWKTDFVSRRITSHTDFELDNAGIYSANMPYWNALYDLSYRECSPEYHASPKASANWVNYQTWNLHERFPTGVREWDHQINKRRRFVFKAVPLNDPTLPLGGVGPHFYLPTNDPSLPSHFDSTSTPITEFPTGTASAGTTFESLGNAGKAPGIRNDGMCMGYANPGGDYQWDPNGLGDQDYSEIPQKKQWDAAVDVSGDPDPKESAMAGTVTWQIMEPFTESDDSVASKNPAIWETEPKEDVGLDIYHEVGQIYPNDLNDETIEQFVGAVSGDINKNSYVQCWDPVTGNILLETGPGETDIRILAVQDNKVMLGSAIIGSPFGTPLDSDPLVGHITPTIGSLLMIWRADGSLTEARVKSIIPAATLSASWYELGGKAGEFGVHNEEVRLPWFNCYSFGNGVESDRIRDDFNQVTIDNGPKASTTLEEPYLEERRKNGFIWSGLYNSTSGVNNTNQFIQAEKITKDVNPSYGSIQKLFARDSDLVAFCEDRVLKVFANKDALYNADGNVNLISTDRVLGNIKPFVGDYGISLNPESFASDSYRSYFSDSSRGAILRLSQDGLTPISNAGMHDWFADRLALTEDNKIIGSFDDNKNEYNITLKNNEYHKFKVRILGFQKGPGDPYEPSNKLIVTNSLAQLLSVGDVISGAGILQSTTVVGKLNLGGGLWQITISQIPNITFLGSYSGYGLAGGGEVVWNTVLLIPNEDYEAYTLSYSEKSKGWISFKSWIQENGISLNNNYYTFSGGQMFQHHINETRNNFYYPGSPALLEDYQFESSVDILFNQASGSIKSFSTLNYEGSQARITPEINNNPDYYDNYPKDGWYVKEMLSNAQELGEMEFWDKEDKWFSQIKGVKTEWLNDGTAGNIDPREFSYQGIGNADHIDCPNCPEITTWNCENTPPVDPTDPVVGIDTCSGMVDLGLMAGAGSGMVSFLDFISTSSNGYQSTDVNTLKFYSPGGNYETVPGGGPSCAACTGCPVPYDLPNFYAYIGEIFVSGADPVLVSIGMHQTWIDLITAINNSGIITTVITTSMNYADVNTLLLNEATGYNMTPQIVSDLNLCGCTVSSPGDPGSPGGINCVEVIGTGGEYQTEQECLDNGCGILESWDCGGPSQQCTDPGTGLGQYTTYCDCVLNSGCCGEAAAYAYECQNITPPATYYSGCMDDGITSDPFITQQRPVGWIGIATNYDAGANIHDCACSYITTQCLTCNTAGSDNTVPGCCDPNNIGYNPLATCNDGSCIPDIYGCTDCGDPSNSGCLTGYDQAWWDLAQFSGQSYADITGIPTYPGVPATNYYAGANVDDGSCIYPAPCPQFTHNWSVAVNPPNADCANTFATWTWSFPNWQSGDSWEYTITDDLTGALIIVSVPITIGNGGGTINSLAAGNYTVTITHTSISGQVCIYTLPITISCGNIQSTYSCSGSSGVFNGYPQGSAGYIQPYTCYENLDQFGNSIPPGSTGIWSPGPYLSMSACINDTTNNCS